MSNSYFQFKQFTVWHDKCAMKVGTDGVLLGAWVNLFNAKSVLDIGTGTGLIALMIAQRSTANILAVEIDADAVNQAIENVERSPWSENIKVQHADFKTATFNTKFDVIVSNPPYFSDSLLSPDTQRSTARHTSELTYHDLISRVSGILAFKGEFSLIIPADISDKIKEEASIYNLFPVRQTNVLPKPESAPKRVLITLAFNKISCLIPNDLIVELARHRYSEDYISLTKYYYLKM